MERYSWALIVAIVSGADLLDRDPTAIRADARMDVLNFIERE